MMKITQDQALDRWDELPEILRDALYSESNSDFLWKTCESEHIPDAKIYGAAKISGYVLMGFLHPEDVATALQETIGVDQRTAKEIEAALNQRIFSPLRSDIDKIYAPLSKFALSGPKLIQEVKPPQAPAPTASGPQIISQSFMAVPKISTVPMRGTQAQPPEPTPAKPPSSPSSNAGWSKQAPQGPVIKLGVFTPNIPSPSTNAASASKPAPVKPQFTPAQSTTRGMSEFERLDIMKKGVAPQTPQSPNAPIPTPPPMMLHQTSGPTAPSPDFHFKTGTEDQIAGARPKSSLPGKPVVLELGKTLPTSVPQQSQQPPQPPRPPSVNNGSRQINEITPPANPPEKVIIKDFLGPQKDV